MMKGDLRCVEGRVFRHDPQHDDPDLETDVGACPGCETCEGRKIITHFVYPPIPYRGFDWQAYFDDDEPDDDGNMLLGSGETEREAIEDLLEKSQ